MAYPSANANIKDRNVNAEPGEGGIPEKTRRGL
jgi:hypothetical protein